MQTMALLYVDTQSVYDTPPMSHESRAMVSFIEVTYLTLKLRSISNEKNFSAPREPLFKHATLLK